RAKFPQRKLGAEERIISCANTNPSQLLLTPFPCWIPPGLQKMKKDSPEIAGYTVLPVQLPPTPAFPKPATHYLYLRPHEPRIPDPDSPRSLFIVNTPIDTTE